MYMLTKGKILIVYFDDSSLGITMPKHSTIWIAQNASIRLLSSLYRQWGEIHLQKKINVF